MSFLHFPKSLLNARFCAHMRVIVYTFAAIISSQCGFAQCPSTAAYTGASSSGNQSYGERLGLNFSNSSTIVVSELRAYDSGQNGINLPIQVAIINTVTSAVVAGPVTFNGTTDPLVGFYRTRTISPVALPPGQYVVVAVGYGSTELNGNNNIPVYPNVTTNSGGVLTFTNSSFGGTGMGVPATSFGNAAVFHAGSFSFYTDGIDPEIECPDDIVMSTDVDRCTAVVCFGVEVDDNCGFNLPSTIPGYTYLGSYNNHNYFTSDNTSDWESANNAAVAAGGNLVAINSSAEQTFLSSLIPNGPTSRFYIGLRYAPSIETYKWTSGEPVTYTNWANGQPGGPINGDYVHHFDAIIPGLRGWYDGPGTVNRRHILEIVAGSPTLVSGLASGSNFPLGETEIAYFVEDAAGNASRCSFTVTVEDNQAPEIICPDDLVIDLDAEECEIEVNYDAPEVDDNCRTSVPVLVSGPTSGSVLNNGEYTVVYSTTDISGNESTCSFTITINDKIAPNLACQPIQLSLDEECEAQVTPYMALTGYLDQSGNVLFGCPDNFIINVIAKNGASLGNTVGVALIGQTLDYTIMNDYGYSCWNTVTIKDKIKPSITCRNLNVNCLEDLTNVGLPVVDDNCGASYKKVSEVFDNTINCDANRVGRLIRTWTAIDPSGNTSDTCTSILSLQRPRITGITAAADATFECDEVLDIDSNGNPLPSESGIPMLGTKPLYPTSALEMQYCNATIEYKDQIVIDNDCKKIISRRWRILEWWCGDLIEHFIDEQRISILDTEGPEFGPVNDLTFSTLSQSCTGRVVLPAVDVDDNCNTVPKVTVSIINGGTPVKTLNTNGGTVDLPTGLYGVIYTAIDSCHNQSTTRFTVVVKDETDPQAVCAQFSTISVNTTGYTDITAQSIGSSSSDECSAVTLKIRRMDDPCGGGFDTAWYDRVEFCCLDAGTRPMIQLLVTDAGNNTNICMVSVQVQDKQNASITCPNDTIVRNCDYVFDGDNATVPFGEADIIDNCPANTKVIETVSDNRTNCGTGDVIRTFTLNPLPPFGGICRQVITFENNDPFYINTVDFNDPNDDIEWPKDYTTSSTCLKSALEPGMLPDSSARPRVVDGKCDLVGMNFEDRNSSPASNGACFKILRTWSIVDWCQEDKNGDPLTWEYEQELLVFDNRPPVFDANTQPKTISIVDCGQARISFTARATDCTPANELVYSYEISQGTSILKSGSGRVAVDTLPVGTYHIEFTCSDRCGNISNQEFDFTIVSTKAPIAICRNITINLVNNNTDISRTISVNDIDLKSNHACGYPVTLSFNATSSVLTRTFTCAQRNTVVTVPLYITASNGTTGFCNAMVSVQDSNRLCTNNITSNIAGRLATFDDKVLSNAVIDLQGIELKTTNTNINGQYSFADNVNGANYNVVPRCDNNPLNGVSTLDLVTIQRHVLGIQKITNPYLLIAADIDHNDKITSSDLVHLRKVILGTTAAFTDNTSWRFVDKDYQFIDDLNPWMAPIKEAYDISDLQGDMTINFVGVKIGDVNGSFNPATENNTENRSVTSFVAEDRNVNIGDEIHIPFVTDSDTDIIGLQMKFETKNLDVMEIRSDILSVSNENMHKQVGGLITMSIHNPQEIKLAKGQSVMTLKVKANRSGKLSEMIRLSDDQFTEYYTNTNDSRSINISWAEKASTFKLLNAAPNPWTTSTTIGYVVPEAGNTTLKVYDFSGKEYVVRSMECKEGENQFVVSKTEINRSGVYIYEIEYNGQKVTGKMILME